MAEKVQMRVIAELPISCITRGEVLDVEVYQGCAVLRCSHGGLHYFNFENFEIVGLPPSLITKTNALVAAQQAFLDEGNAADQALLYSLALERAYTHHTQNKIEREAEKS